MYAFDSKELLSYEAAEKSYAFVKQLIVRY